MNIILNDYNSIPELYESISSIYSKEVERKQIRFTVMAIRGKTLDLRVLDFKNELEKRLMIEITKADIAPKKPEAVIVLFEGSQFFIQPGEDINVAKQKAENVFSTILFFRDEVTLKMWKVEKTENERTLTPLQTRILKMRNYHGLLNFSNCLNKKEDTNYIY